MRTTPVVIILDPAMRREPEQLRDLAVQLPGGIRVPLRELADITVDSGRASILREGARRRQVVTCGIEGRDEASTTDAIIKALGEAASQTSWPKGVYASVIGNATAARAARDELLFHAAVAFVGVTALLALALGRARQVALVLANVPFALVGGVLALVVASQVREELGVLGMGALVGFVTLFGITMRNSIMLISHYEHLVTAEGREWSLVTVITGAGERLPAILMTALVTGLGLMPLALKAGEAGREIEGPMAIVILGGLITSTILNLLVLPALAWRWAKFS
jgi:Cu/Ag efflux pump CusA